MKTMTCRWRLARLPPDLCTGSATAEFAIVLPSIIAIAGLILAIGRVVIVSMDCQSAAAAAAREFVVTGDESPARSIAADVAGGRAPRQHCPRRPIDECDGRMFGIARSAGCHSNAGYRQRYGDKPITVGWLGGRNRKELRCRECVMRRDRARWPEPCWLWWWALRSRWRQVWATS